MDIRTQIAIGSALVHASELLSELEPTTGVHALAGAAAFDAAALRTNLDDVGLKEWLAAMPPGLLPVKRSG